MVVLSRVSPNGFPPYFENMMSERAVWSARLESRLAEERRGRTEKLRVAGRRGPGEWRSAVREPRLVRRGACAVHHGVRGAEIETSHRSTHTTRLIY